jgi:hypothetical protein
LMDSIKSPVSTPATAAGLALATPTTCTDTRSVGRQTGRQAARQRYTMQTRATLTLSLSLNVREDAWFIPVHAHARVCTVHLAHTHTRTCAFIPIIATTPSHAPFTTHASTHTSATPSTREANFKPSPGPMSPWLRSSTPPLLESRTFATGHGLVDNAPPCTSLAPSLLGLISPALLIPGVSTASSLAPLPCPPH